MKLDPKTQKALEWHLKQYCSACGAKLEVVKKKHYDYHKHSGLPEYIYTIQCPNYRWWNIFKFHESSEYLVCAPGGIGHVTILQKRKY